MHRTTVDAARLWHFSFSILGKAMCVHIVKKPHRSGFGKDSKGGIVRTPGKYPVVQPAFRLKVYVSTIKFASNF
jgi:hypothetical protein